MARCTGSSQCTCVLHAGNGITVDGGGSVIRPYIISALPSGLISTLDTTTITWQPIQGDGSSEPYVLAADAHLALGDLTDASPTPPQTGQVLGWNGTQWAPTAAATAAPGSINAGCGIMGDGSSADPLAVQFDPNSLACNPQTGLSVVFPPPQPLPDNVPLLVVGGALAGTYDPGAPVHIRTVGRSDLTTAADAKFSISPPAGTTCVLGIHIQALSPNTNVPNALVYTVLLDPGDSPNPLQAMRVAVNHFDTAHVSAWVSISYTIYYQTA